MAGRLFALQEIHDRIPIPQIFRDRRHPLERFDDFEVYHKYRFPRLEIYHLTDEVAPFIQVANRGEWTVPPLLQICITLRFYASGSFQDIIGDCTGKHDIESFRSNLLATQTLTKST